MRQSWYQRLDPEILFMAEGTRMSQLQDGLASRKKSTDSDCKTLETEMLALKRLSHSIIQQLAALTLQMLKKN